VIKIKALLPTLKDKKRYVLYEISSMGNIKNHEKFMKEKIGSFIGDLGIARAGLRFIKSKNNRGVIQVNNKYVDEIRAGLALVQEINNKPVRIRTVKVSGIINKLNF